MKHSTACIFIIAQFPEIRRLRTTPVLNYGKNTGKYSDLLLAENFKIPTYTMRCFKIAIATLKHPAKRSGGFTASAIRSYSLRTAFPNFFSDRTKSYAYYSKTRQRSCSGFSPDSFYVNVSHILYTCIPTVFNFNYYIMILHFCQELRIQTLPIPRQHLQYRKKQQADANLSEASACFVWQTIFPNKRVKIINCTRFSGNFLFYRANNNLKQLRSVRSGLDTLLVSVDHFLDHLTAYRACFS